MSSLRSSVARIVDVVATRRPAGPVDITGAGDLADAVRAAIRPAGSAGAPACIVETTGRPDVIEWSLSQLADLGLLVLAGAPQPLTLDLYSHVHVRGLRIVGVAPTSG